MNAVALCQKLEWDSDFFGASVARALPSAVDATTCAEILEWCESHAIECLYFLCASNNHDTATILERAAFELVDIRLTLERTLAGSELLITSEASTHRVRIRASEIADIQALRIIASVAHRDTRFHHDGRFNPQRCDELYATWIHNSCLGYADHVLVAEANGAPVGYLSLHLETSGARIGLLAVDASWRRCGVARRLVTSAFAWLVSRNVGNVSVVTTGRNLAAQAFYQGMGFRISDKRFWYHRWFQKPK